MSAKLWPPSPTAPIADKKIKIRHIFLYIYQSNRNALKWTILIKKNLKKRVVADLPDTFISKSGNLVWIC